MGCTPSRQASRELRRSPSPLPRTRSGPLQGKAGGDHEVALISSTLGSLKLDASPTPERKQGTGPEKRDLSAELVKAKAWSDMIDRRIMKTPTRTPPNEPETIDAMELMVGLEDPPPLRLSSAAAAAFDRHSFSFPATREADPVVEPMPSPELAYGSSSPGPIRTPQKSNMEPTSASDFDPEVVSTYRKAMEELSPQHPSLLLLRSPESNKTASKRRSPCNVSTGLVRARVSAFQERINAKKANSHGDAVALGSGRCPSGSEGKSVLYFTSLRGVRKTYEDCCLVRMILKGYGARVDERDLSMDRGFKEELNEILRSESGAGMRLPSLFANGKYLGGAEEVRRMHEAGELAKALEGCGEELAGERSRGGPCEACGDVRFVLCKRCSGSCKVYLEEEEEEEEEEEGWEDVDGGFRQCPDCNENGIVRCPLCC